MPFARSRGTGGSVNTACHLFFAVLVLQNSGCEFCLRHKNHMTFQPPLIWLWLAGRGGGGGLTLRPTSSSRRGPGESLRAFGPARRRPGTSASNHIRLDFPSGGEPVAICLHKQTFAGLPRDGRVVFRNGRASKAKEPHFAEYACLEALHGVPWFGCVCHSPSRKAIGADTSYE